MSTNKWFQAEISTLEVTATILLTIILSYVFSSFQLSLFTYEDSWIISISIGGFILPIIGSVYLAVRSKLNSLKLLTGIGIVSFVAYIVFEETQHGIVSRFPFWLLPIILAFIISYLLIRKVNRNVSSYGYISGVIGINIATLVHIPTLMQTEINTPTPIVIGGGLFIDMIFILGVVAIIIEIIMFFSRKKER